MAGKTLDIGEVAHQSGMTPSTLRYYEGRGLIKSVGRNGLRRLFSADVLEKLALINLAKDVGFSLKEISALYDKETDQLDRTRLSDKADELDQTIKRLSAIRDGLRHAVDCPAQRHSECDSFNRYKDVALKMRKHKRS